MSDLQQYVDQLSRRARLASRPLATLDGNTRVAILQNIARSLREQINPLLAANASDIAAAQSANLAPALVKRLELSDKKVRAMAESVEQIAAQTDPIGQIIEGYTRPNGLRIQKVRCPLGVVLFFYESRPNVTSDAAALCIKSGNALILRGGKEAFHSNRAIVEIVQKALVGWARPTVPPHGKAPNSPMVDESLNALIELGKSRGYLTYQELNDKLPDEIISADKLDSFLLLVDEFYIKLIDDPKMGRDAVSTSSPFANRKSQIANLQDAVQFVDSTDRALVPLILKQDKNIDLVIPRGGESLIRAVVAESTIPVLKHYTGNCHIYIDRATAGMEQMITDICVNAKTSYPGGAVCNAVEHLLFHKEAAPRLLKKVCEALAAKNVEIRGDAATQQLYPNAIPATPQDWDTEYLAYTLAIKVVDNIQQAIDHINDHGSHHTDAILSSDTAAIQKFTTEVDSASVIINASTRFADGGEYGLGAEIGISTDKLHARGPMGANDLTTYKWVVTGNGHCR
jgi:gamma-glutamyl phosphate reductase